MVIRVGQLVLVHHGIMIYDAKVLKIDDGKGVTSDPEAEMEPTENTQYFVHYVGWRKKWDEWAELARVLVDTPANRRKQQENNAKAKEKKPKKRSTARKKKISVHGIDSTTASASPFKKMRINPDNDTEELPSEKVEGVKPLNLPMPFTLKKMLVEDWKRITHEPYKLVPLPRKPNVSQIIQGYMTFKKSKAKADEASEKELESLQGIMEGIQHYFDRALGYLLLYRMERKQYEDTRAKHPDTPMSEIYGIEHLVRLFVRLPVLLGSAELPAKDVGPLQARLADFLKYLQKNSATWMLADYETIDEKDVHAALVQASEMISQSDQQTG